MIILKVQKEICNIKITLGDDEPNRSQSSMNEKNDRLYALYEKVGDAYCNLGLYELGLNSYLEQVRLALAF